MNATRRNTLKSIAALTVGSTLPLRSWSAEKDRAPGYAYESRYAKVLDSTIHYVDAGKGDPIVFLHGNPTSSYLWRNIAPELAGQARIIVPDLIGMGRSGKPDSEYRFVDHARYMDAFLGQLGLRNITFVGHDWGGGLAFHYAMRNERNIKGLAFLETFVRSLSWDDWPAPYRDLFRQLRTPDVGWDLIAKQNIFVEGILPAAIVRKLAWHEREVYRAPFPTEASRKPVWRWPNELPLGGEPADVVQLVDTYSRWLQRTQLPKLLFYATPGALIPAPMVSWCEQHLPNLKTVWLGEGIHFLQEDNPYKIAYELSDWYGNL